MQPFLCNLDYFCNPSAPRIVRFALLPLGAQPEEASALGKALEALWAWPNVGLGLLLAFIGPAGPGPHRSTADNTGARQTTQEHGARQNRSTAEHTGARQNTPRTHADTRATTYLRGRPTTEHTSHAWWTKATLPVLVRSGFLLRLPSAQG